jgi:hypothetical protein
MPGKESGPHDAVRGGRSGRGGDPRGKPLHRTEDPSAFPRKGTRRQHRLILGRGHLPISEVEGEGSGLIQSTAWHTTPHMSHTDKVNLPF